jgi:uncharacterized protein (DUF433 family)
MRAQADPKGDGAPRPDALARIKTPSNDDGDCGRRPSQHSERAKLARGETAFHCALEPGNTALALTAARLWARMSGGAPCIARSCAIYIFINRRTIMSSKLLSKSEAAFVAGLDATAVDRAIDQLRIGRPFVQRRRRARLLTPKGAFLIAADHLIARDVAAPARKDLRKLLAALLKEKPIEAVEELTIPSSALPMTIDFKPVSNSVAKRLSALEEALDLIVEDEEVQAGAPTFRGTRILVRPIAAALHRGVRVEELREDYGLSAQQIAAARVYADARPQRGRPPASASG